MAARQVMLDKVTKETFEPITGQVFQLALGDGRHVPLELAAVLGTGLQGAASREQFSLHFRGPSTPMLSQQIYRLVHSDLGILDLFLVPIGRDAAGMIYEAVFT
jgi:hypothetical protein